MTITNIDFKNIRIHKTSQNEGFEELCCQLLSIQPQQNGVEWIRKRGDGGDGGVEAYWILNNGEEHCLQTKYFFDFGSAQRQQMKKSVTQMLTKHPNCTKYIFAIPFDLTDSRSDRGKSQREHWNNMVTKWVDDAAPRQLEFELWDSSKLSTLLSIDDPNFSGRRHYWLNEKCLSKDWICKRVGEAINNLGERYTPEMHVDLPLSKKLKAFIQTPSFWEELGDTPQLPNVHSSQKSVMKIKYQVQVKVKLVLDKIISMSKNKKMMPEIKVARTNVDDTIKMIEKSLEGSDDKTYTELNKLRRETLRVVEHLQEVGEQFALAKTLVIFGDAGTGKSHLLADIARHAANQQQPVILVLGQQFKSGQPISFIKNSLDWMGEFDDLLVALDSAAQSKGCKALIAIDALNEGSGKLLWPDELAGFINRVSRFEYIGLVVSCRTTYKKRLFKNVSTEQFQELQHFGFYGHEEAAAKMYMDSRGISRPEAPFLDPEFSNPLFLKTICDTIIRNDTQFPKGLRGVTNIFGFYRDGVAEAIEERLDLDSSQKLVHGFIDLLIEKIISVGNDNLERKTAQIIADSVLPSNGDAERNLITQLISEGLLSEDISYSGDEDNQGSAIIRFSYERYLDYFRARHFLTNTVQNSKIQDVFKKKGSFWSVINNRLWFDSGFIEALSVLVPEQYGTELYELVELDEENRKDQQLKRMMKDGFKQSLVWRNPSKTNKDTLNQLNTVLGGLSPDGFEMLVRCATEPNHFFNAQLMHRNLIQMTMAKRDASWSIWCAKEWHDPEDNGASSPIWILIGWSLLVDTTRIDDERLYLSALALSWFFTSPKRELRDKATKALVSILGTNTKVTRRLILSFQDVNDPYVLERVLLAAYAVAIEVSSNKIAPLIKTVVNRFIRSNINCEHVLARDYISGMLFLGKKYGCLPNNFSMSGFKFKNTNDFPPTIPNEYEINYYKEENSSVYYSVMSGDFGTYVMNKVFDFSPTLLNVAKPDTGDESISNFLESIYIRSEGFREVAQNYFTATEDMKRYENLKNLIEGKNQGWLFVGEQASEIDIEELEKEYDVKKHKAAKKLHQETKEKFDEGMGDEEKEEWRWLIGAGRSGFTKYSRRKAKRWIIQKVSDLGWKKELFESFERTHCVDRGRNTHNIERIGKKYQWIAYYQFLAKLANNNYFFDWNNNYRPCEGAWELSCRNIDPTLLHSGKQLKMYKDEVWWLNLQPDLSEEIDVKGVSDWIRSNTDLPKDFDGLIQVDKETENKYCVLNASQNTSGLRHDSNSSYRRLAQSISTVIVKTEHLNETVKHLSGKMIHDEFKSPHEYSGRAFISEYPWHPSWNNTDEDFFIPMSFDKKDFPRPVHYPLQGYFWDDEYDHSIDEAVSYDLPSKMIIDGLNIKYSRTSEGYVSEDNCKVFFNPAFRTNKLPCSLILKSKIEPWLNENNYTLIWVISTRKQYITTNHSEYFGESCDFQLCWLEDGVLKGKRWSMLTEKGPKYSILKPVNKID